MTISRRASFGRVVAAYGVAFAFALFTWFLALVFHESFGMPAPLMLGAMMDVVATLVVFGFSVALKNSSTYDAYWSVAPMALAAYWAAIGHATTARVVVVVVLVMWWGARLTWNWARTWSGLHHEDWRYVDLRRKSGRAWPLVNLLGIHLFPTAQVFLGLLPVHAALSIEAPLGLWDAVGAVVTTLAILIEQVSDKQLLEFRKATEDEDPRPVMNKGLWAWSRHPNYVGEALFWWGLAFFGLQTTPGQLWRFSGAAAITLMFVFISIPMIEKRHLSRRANYARDAAQGIFFPRRP